MAGEILKANENARLQTVPQEDVRVQLSVTGGAPLRLLGVLLDENGKPVGPAPLLTWRTPTDGVQIKLNKGETIGAILHTAALRDPVQAIMFIVAPYARSHFSPGERILTAIASEGAEPIAIESIAPDGMQTLALCDFYRHPQHGGKVRCRDEWRHREATVLLERLGVATKILTDQNLYPLPHMRHTEKDRASLNTLLQSEPAAATLPTEDGNEGIKTNINFDQPAETKPSPITKDAETICLDQVGAQTRLMARGSHFGKVEINFCWHQRLAKRAAVRLDVGCFWELQDGKKGQLEGLSNLHGSLSAPPFVALSGETHHSGALCHEKMMINGDQWGQIRRVLFYAMIHEGPLQWGPLDARVTLLAPQQTPVHLDLITENKNGPIAALMLLENRSDQMRIVYPGGFFESHYALDAAFDFQLRWRTNTAQPGTASDQDWVPPAPMNFFRKWFGIMFGSTMYNEAEDLMRASLAAAAMVMVADGQVSMDERKHVVEALMALPMGSLFAEYEVRNGLEAILRDLKNHRKPSEHLVLQLISTYRSRHDEAKTIVQAMRRAAMVDGQVNMHEERMVERLTGYLKAQGD
jgi:uncharacterized protein involved in tellurium resistance/tellurite resistance protein